VLALVSSLLSGAISTSAAPEPTLSFPLEADASIKAGSPGGNFGTASKLEVDGSPLKHTLLRFTVSGVGSAQVLSAKLRLYDVDSSNAGGTFYPVADDAWLESSVTWNNAPAAGPGPLASLGSVSSGTWYEVDLSTYVTGDGTYSLRMQSTSSNGADYTSAEGTAANRPTVVVTLSSDTVAPTVSIGSPAADATLAGLITVLSDASDDTGVAVVDLFLDGVLLGSDLSAPYEIPWDTRSTQNGTHELQARATDASGNTTDSAIVGVTVDNAPDLGPPEPPHGSRRDRDLGRASGAVVDRVDGRHRRDRVHGPPRGRRGRHDKRHLVPGPNGTAEHLVLVHGYDVGQRSRLHVEGRHRRVPAGSRRHAPADVGLEPGPPQTVTLRSARDDDGWPRRRSRCLSPRTA